MSEPRIAKDCLLRMRACLNKVHILNKKEKPEHYGFLLRSIQRDLDNLRAFLQVEMKKPR